MSCTFRAMGALCGCGISGGCRSVQPTPPLTDLTVSLEGVARDNTFCASGGHLPGRPYFKTCLAPRVNLTQNVVV